MGKLKKDYKNRIIDNVLDKITKVYNDKQNKCAPYEAVIVKLERR
mgnify:CR=1 FL=1